MLVIYEITNQSPKTWDNYLKLLMQAYKALYLDKVQGAIFGPETIGEKWWKEGPKCNRNR